MKAGGHVIYKKFNCLAEAIIWYMYKAFDAGASVQPISPEIKTLLTHVEQGYDATQDPGKSYSMD